MQYRGMILRTHKFVDAIQVMNNRVLIVITFFACLGIIVLRNPEPLLNPSFYGEDAPWLSSIMNHGFWASTLHLKYFLVFYQQIILGIALKINLLCFRGSILHLPLTIAFLSYTHYAFVFILPLIIFKHHIPKPHLFLFCIAFGSMSNWS